MYHNFSAPFIFYLFIFIQFNRLRFFSCVTLRCDSQKVMICSMCARMDECMRNDLLAIESHKLCWKLHGLLVWQIPPSGQENWGALSSLDRIWIKRNAKVPQFAFEWTKRSPCVAALCVGVEHIEMDNLKVSNRSPKWPRKIVRSCKIMHSQYEHHSLMDILSSCAPTIENCLEPGKQQDKWQLSIVAI